MLIDTHCHLASAKFGRETPELVHRAREAGVDRMLTLSTGFADIPRNLELAAGHPGTVFAAVGIHPCDVDEEPPENWQDLLAAAAREPGVVAIGETGLDYYHPPPPGWELDVWRARQRDFLIRHFEVAAAAGLPIVLHTRDREGRDSLQDALRIASGFRGRARPMFHCFLGPWDDAERILNLDGIVSFGGIVTFPKAHETREAARNAPPGSFTLETDAPYLAPVPERGHRNEPAFVAHTARALAAARGESMEELAGHTTSTARDFFRIS